MHKEEKAIRIAEVAIGYAAETRRLIAIAYPRKRPRICAPALPRAHGQARKRARIGARVQMQLAMHIAMAQVQLILSQPIPKYKPGRAINALPAIVNEYGKETYVRPGSTDSPQGQEDCTSASAFKTNAVQQVPSRQCDYIREMVLRKLERR